MTRISTHAVLRTVATLLSLSAPLVAQAAPYYVSWSQLYEDSDPSRQQTATAVALDSRGNVFVTGFETVGTGTGIYVAKYDGLDGHQLWERRVNSGSTIFKANSIAVDSAGNCVVAGSINAGNINYYTIKLKGTDGTNFWAAGAKVRDGGNSGADEVLKVICDHADDVIVTGRSTGQNGMGNNSGYDWVTVKYDRDAGTELAVSSYSQTTTNLDDIPTGLAVDSSNNVIVCGSVQTGVNNQHFYLRKLKAADLTKLWDIVPIDTGANNEDAEFGATAVAVDANNSIVATGCARDATDHFGYFTIKYTSAGTKVWQTSFGPFSQSTFGDVYGAGAIGGQRPRPVGLAIGPDNSPIVTGTLLDAGGNPVIRTIKYTSGGFMGGAAEFWSPAPPVDEGAGFGTTIARAIAADSVGNAIVVGETQNEDGNTDLYVARYDAQTGNRTYGFTLTGNSSASTDKGVDVAVDRLGNITALGTLRSAKGGSSSAGFNEFGTLKLNRLIAPTGDDLPNFITGVDDDAKVAAAAPPSVGDNGVLATRLTFKAGKKSTNAVLVENAIAGGGTLVPAVKGQPAPVGAGDADANWVSFSDPVVAPNGHYAFAAKVSGPGAKANGVWGNLNGNLVQILRQGSVPPITNFTDKIVSVTNIGLSSNALIALVKLTGPASSNIAVIRVDNANNGAVLLRTGQSDFMIDGTAHTIKAITVFSPAPSEAGDGRWQGPAGVVVRVSAVKTSDPKSKATAIVAIANGGGPIVQFFTGQAAAAPVANATYSGFGLPSTGTGTQRFTVKATLTPASSATNAALIYALNNVSTPNAYAQKGQPTKVVGLDASITYADFTDPIINTNTLIAFIATLKGSPALVKSSSNKAIVFGSPTGFFIPVARTGDAATDSAGNESDLKWTAFTALANPGGTNAGPIFIGKLGTKKNNLGLWARDTSGKVRLLLRQGDQLGDQTVKKFTLLTPVSKAMAAARSFDAVGSVAVFINFTDGTTAIQRIGIP